MPTSARGQNARSAASAQPGEDLEPRATADIAEVLSTRRRAGRIRAAAWILAGLASAVAWAPAARAQVVSGRVVVEAEPTKTLWPRGYVSFRATAGAEEPPVLGRSYVVFLRVKDSLPLEAAPTQSIALSGLQLEPRVAACAVDGQVELRNDDTEPATFVVGDRTLGPVAPGEQAIYECTAEEGDAVRPVRVIEWPFVRGGIYVAGNGVPALADEQGRFRILAARGTYALQVVGLNGVLLERDVEVDERPVEVGTLSLAEDGEEAR